MSLTATLDTLLGFYCNVPFFKFQRKHLILSIKEKSKRAWLAAKVLKANQVAIVFGSTIYLHNTSKERFLSNKQWVRHELKHIEQYHRLSYWTFLFSYLLQSIKYGYCNNKYEVEARQAENDETIVMSNIFTLP